MQAAPQNPIRFEPSMEVAETDEVQTIAELSESLRSISRITWEDSGHALRSVHAKGHGVLKGELRVLANLPDVLAQGVFATAATYRVVVRLSTSPGDVLDDKVSTPRGFALKLLDVATSAASTAPRSGVQDFLFVNGPSLGAKNAKAFLRNVKLLAPTTDKAPALKKAFSAALRGIESVLEAAGGESGTLKALGGHPLTDLLGETFFTQVPILYGAYIAKLSVVPASPSLIALKNAKLDLDDHPNGIREAVSRYFRDTGGEWELRVQLCVDLDKMPVENAATVWPEDLSPFIPVARIHVPAQGTWSDAATPAVEDRLAFTPWHCIEEHRPLGSINRARKVAYDASSGFRAEHNRLELDARAAG